VVDYLSVVSSDGQVSLSQMRLLVLTQELGAIEGRFEERTPRRNVFSALERCVVAKSVVITPAHLNSSLVIGVGYVRHSRPR
jgi:hypothetical protein